MGAVRREKAPPRTKGDESEKSEEYARFESLMKRLVRVPKRAIPERETKRER